MTKSLPSLIRSASDIAATLAENGGELTAELELQSDLNAIELAHKIDQYAFVQGELEMRAEYARGMIKQWQAYAKSCDTAVDNINSRLFWAMSEQGALSLAGNQAEFVLKSNPPKVVISNESLIPEEFKSTVVTTTIDKNALKDFLKSGKEVAGASLVQEARVARKVSATKITKR